MILNTYLDEVFAILGMYDVFHLFVAFLHYPYCS